MGHQGATKSYVAIVHGVPAWEEQACDAPIGLIGQGQLGVAADGRAASSTFRVVARSAEHSVLAVTIATGRTHQIRIHSQALGHALVGEEWYRDEPCRLHVRQALHASALSIAGPHALLVTAPLPQDLVDLLGRLNLSLGDVVVP